MARALMARAPFNDKTSLCEFSQAGSVNAFKFSVFGPVF